MESEDPGGEPHHVPVLAAETMHFLEPERGGCFVDCTVGLGGHAALLLERAPAASLVGLDRDEAALERAARRLAPFGDRVRLVAGRFDELERRLGELGVTRVSGVLADLGVSSLQLGRAGRGFSFQLDGPLDMRMGRGELTAAEVVETYSEEALSKILKEYGEERQARRIARAIVEERGHEPLATTGQLLRLVERVKRVPPGPRRIRPATQTFQALRIEVNQELEQLHALLDQSIRLLEHKGRLVLISYHSLEDRIVKNTLRDLASGEVDPATGARRSETQVIEVLTRKPVRPSAVEVAANPRARSALLRAARRL